MPSEPVTQLGTPPTLIEPPELQRELLVNCTPQETRIAVVENGTVQELHIERASRRGLVGNIYRGKVVRVLPGMQSAFVDVGLERTAFLHVTDLLPSGAEVTRGEMPRIERLLREGEEITVQIVKDPIGSKGARLTMQLSLAGRFLVYLPHDDGQIGISQKIEDEHAREALRARLTALRPSHLSGGFIVRTNALEASDEQLAADIAYLEQVWQEIQQKAGAVRAPALLYDELDLVLRVVRDLADRHTVRIQVDSRENAQRMIAFAQRYAPHVLPLIELYRGERPLFARCHVEEEIERALARRVELKSGGYLIFDQTEALTTIDVNTGAFVGAKSFDETILKTNLEAAQTIARQLRLRNLGGIILVDFIDMTLPEHRERVLEAFQKALARDPTKTTVSGFTQLGLVELTRKRTRESLSQQLCEPCPTCAGRGFVKTAETVCFEILRELVREARQFPHVQEFLILAAPAVVRLFEEEHAQALAMASEFLGKPIALRGEADYPPEHYDIVVR
ncbi:MAG: ribonuclease G [Hydrogenophilus thermoluteolus]